MKSVHLLYSANSVVRHLESYLWYKNYDVLSIDKNEGVIHAAKKRFFGKNLLVDFNVHGVDSSVTALNLSVRSEKDPTLDQLTYNERKELELLESIEDFW